MTGIRETLNVHKMYFRKKNRRFERRETFSNNNQTQFRKWRFVHCQLRIVIHERRYRHIINSIIPVAAIIISVKLKRFEL